MAVNFAQLSELADMRPSDKPDPLAARGEDIMTIDRVQDIQIRIGALRVALERLMIFHGQAHPAHCEMAEGRHHGRWAGNTK
jgi:hypothetical protein